MPSPVKLIRTTVNGQTGPAVTDSSVLTIRVMAEGRPRTMEAELLRGSAVLWASGPMPFTPRCVTPALPLDSCSAYRVRVSLSDGVSRVESTVPLLTGRMDSPWQARWIEPEQEDGVEEGSIRFFEQFAPLPTHFGGHERLRPVQELRRVFTLREAPEQAVLCASAHGVYALSVNGQPVDGRRLAPETTPYQAMLYYQVYDLTPLLWPGENTLTVLVGDGWWIGRIGLTGDSCQYGRRLGFFAQLTLTGSDGGRTVIATDETFESRPSYVTYADLFMGEKWDLTHQPAPWAPCIPVEAPTEVLTLQPTRPVTTLERIPPVAWITTPKGELVADFGRCLAGVADLTLTCPAGRVVTLDHSETLDPEGNFFRNILGRNKDQQDVVVCTGGQTRFCPRFTYHGFRYLRIDGAAREEIASLTAAVVGTPLTPLGSFQCSHQGLNQLQANICNSTVSNMVSVPTDCPQREKAGWTGDLQVFAPTGCFNFDLESFLSGWLGQMRAEQTADGGIPIVIPSYPAQTEMQAKTFGGNTSAAWSDACVLVPLALYRAYGDPAVLSDNLPMMEGWLEFIRAAASIPPEDYNSRDERAKARCPYLWLAGYHFGDWLIPSFQDDIQGGTAATANVISACQYAVTVAAFVEVLEALHAPAEQISRFRTLLGNIRRAVREEFVVEDGTVRSNLQGPYVMVLHSGAVEGELARRVADKLARRMEEQGGLDTGFVSTPHLLDVLSANGYEDLAWKLLFCTESPGWLYQVGHGATSIWENWNAIRPDGTVTTSSYNHYALGCVGDWIYRRAGGLTPTGPGWSSVRIAPAIRCGLSWARCAHRTPWGEVSCRWERQNGITQVEVAVPWGVEAVISLPGVEGALTPGDHQFTVRED